jgi:hypothetical protein
MMDQIYIVAISYIIDYTFNMANAGTFLPVFFMGNGLQYYLYNRLGASTALVKSMSNMQNKNYPIRITMNPSESYTYNSISSE